MLPRLEVLSEHDRARIVEFAAKAMKQVDLVWRLVVDESFHDARVGSSDNVSPNGGSLEREDQFTTGRRGLQHGNRFELRPFRSGQLLPGLDFPFPLGANLGLVWSLKIPLSETVWVQKVCTVAWGCFLAVTFEAAQALNRRKYRHSACDTRQND